MFSWCEWGISNILALNIIRWFDSNLRITDFFNYLAFVSVQKRIFITILQLFAKFTCLHKQNKKTEL